LKDQDSNRKLVNVGWAIFGWLVLTSLYALYYVVSNLTGPPTDAYAMTWDFQLLMFAIFRLPYLVLLLFVLIAVAIVLPPRKDPDR